MEESSSADFDTIPKRLKCVADRYPEREIFICVGKDSRYAFTAGSLLRLAGKFATRLLDYGFKHGDVIANTLPNSPERIITDLGIILAGCVGLNGQILLADGSDFLDSAWKARCNGLILCPEEWSPTWVLLRSNIADQDARMFSPISHQQVTDMTKAVLVRSASSFSRPNDQPSFLDDLETGAETAPPLDLCQPDDVMYVLSSSGSSGFSKLIPHTHREAVVMGAPWFARSRSDQDVPKEFSARPLGPSVFTGFFNRQASPDPATSLAFTPECWYRTEDFGWFNEGGSLYVLGRARDVISRDGIHLYPGWLEAKIIQHQDILEAVILPVSDTIRHHKICAIVKTHPESTLNETELEEFSRSIFLANTRDNYVPMPDFFKILKGKDFPQTATGKPDLHSLRKIVEDQFGANTF
ncbi:hypothetical protein EGW08_001488 [Elysia chlorotica]|uniref:AMP-dependent synthetase/ligase domain-containing protein n=1 Tax=Elysia chlorotica TaxID=188477 RepID=A0A3S1BSW8_ELYCH|nr:hypothetical protein EGW08_001488 [Elysia chlorotica]